MLLLLTTATLNLCLLSRSEQLRAAKSPARGQPALTVTQLQASACIERQRDVWNVLVLEDNRATVCNSPKAGERTQHPSPPRKSMEGSWRVSKQSKL